MLGGLKDTVEFRKRRVPVSLDEQSINMCVHNKSKENHRRANKRARACMEGLPHRTGSFRTGYHEFGTTVPSAIGELSLN